MKASISLFGAPLKDTDAVSFGLLKQYAKTNHYNISYLLSQQGSDVSITYTIPSVSNSTRLFINGLRQQLNVDYQETLSTKILLLNWTIAEINSVSLDILEA